MINEKELKNLTPHEITIFRGRGNPLVSIPPSGVVARISVAYNQVTEISGIPVYNAVYGGVTGLPEPQAGVIFIVSGMVAAMVTGREEDVFSPGELIRDESGYPAGCNGLKKSGDVK